MFFVKKRNVATKQEDLFWCFFFGVTEPLLVRFSRADPEFFLGREGEGMHH